ncbi:MULTISPECIES: ABC transporter substrate-binding protein [unclassified Mycobacterium]|uniref:ABC transporter substrate-binding protein n=1 Tax=unclassified Mycobacterium TaxID=2642494 RepID=UPI0029C80C9B|nr:MULTISPECIES: ABC transporter substrate-binding protein [unclassified Mycobacterium]
MDRPIGRHPLASDIDYTKEPFRIGVLSDLPGYAGLADVWVDGLRLAFEHCTAVGIIDRPVDLVISEELGQPWRSGQYMVRAWNDLVDQDVLGVAGPMTTDNSLAVLSEVLRRGVPTMTLCGSQIYVGHAAFNLSNGGMADEPAVMAAWLANEGHSRVAVLYDSPSQIGAEYLAYFLRSAAFEHLQITAQIPLSPMPTQAETDAAVQLAKESGADGVVYFTLGAAEATSKLPRAFSRLEWSPPRIACTAFVQASYTETFRGYWEGWTGVDQVHEGNSVFQQLLDRFDQRFGYRPVNSAATCAWDVGHSFGIALGRMRVISPAGLRDSLETVRRLPAASGGPGTTITFGPEDHRGYKGPDFLLLRNVTNAVYGLTGTVPVVAR